MCVAEALDREWDRCGRPTPFTMVDAGAGPGTLARAVLAAEPRCRAALDYVVVERSAHQRRTHPDTVRSLAELPSGPTTGVILANELLDNLAFQPLLAVDGEWREAVVDVAKGRLTVVPGDRAPDGPATGGSDYIAQRAVADWVAQALATLEEGRLIVVDYARTSSRDVEVRTYRGHERGVEPLVHLGLQDITVDVDLEQLAQRGLEPDRVRSQERWLDDLGIRDLVEQGRQLWSAGAAAGGLDALAGRSRVREAEALTDPTGLGGFTVAEWVEK